MLNTFIISLLVAFTFSFLYNILLIRKIEKLTALFATPQVADKREEHELTSYELERLEREEQFDSRINKLKEELAQQQAFIERTGVMADELHPLVKNLPHTNIGEKEPDMEYAD